MTATITPAPLAGRVEAIGSKSAAHRHLICAALGDGATELRCPARSEDVEATVSCLTALGACVEERGETLRVTPIKNPLPEPRLDCAESGSTLRFLLPVAAALCPGARFTGRGRLPERPLGALLSAMEANGVTASASALPLATKGRLRAGIYELPGNVSSQYVTGLLLALPLLEGESRIVLTGPLESAPYVTLTRSILRQYGVEAAGTAEGFRIPGGQRYRSPGVAAVEGDWSNAAFFLAAGAIGGGVTVGGLASDSPQGDRAICDLLRQFGAAVEEAGDRVTVSPGPLRGCTVDMRQIPDLLPVLAVLAACAGGESRFYNAARLRDKESDRLAATAALITALGGVAKVLPDGLLVRGGPLRGGLAESAGDHRIAMAAALAAVACREPVTINGAGAVAKSYPGFYEDYRSLGGLINVI